ncbi:MAG: hypothetical protein ABL994_01670 [Verrucomicrobiales bacterium]
MDFFEGERGEEHLFDETAGIGVVVGSARLVSVRAAELDVF